MKLHAKEALKGLKNEKKTDEKGRNIEIETKNNLFIFIIRRLGDRASSLLTLFYCSRGGRPFFSQLPGRTYNSSFCLSLASLSFLAKKSTIYKVCQL